MDRTTRVCPERYNRALGHRRANAAMAYLIERGVPAERLTTISYGERRRFVPGSNEASAQNRRALVMLHALPASH